MDLNSISNFPNKGDVCFVTITIEALGQYSYNNSNQPLQELRTNITNKLILARKLERKEKNQVCITRILFHNILELTYVKTLFWLNVELSDYTE